MREYPVGEGLEKMCLPLYLHQRLTFARRTLACRRPMLWRYTNGNQPGLPATADGNSQKGSTGDGGTYTHWRHRGGTVVGTSMASGSVGWRGGTHLLRALGSAAFSAAPETFLISSTRLEGGINDHSIHLALTSERGNRHLTGLTSEWSADERHLMCGCACNNLDCRTGRRVDLLSAPS